MATQPERITGFLPPWQQSGNRVFEVDGAKSGEAEKNKILVLHRLAKDRSTYDLTICTDCSAMNGTAIGGGGILLTADHQSNPTIHHSYAIPAGTWCSSIQAEMKAIKKALHIIQAEESPPESPNSQRQPISPATYRKPPTPFKSADESDILNILAVLHDEGHQITFTWCPSHCGDLGHEMADE